MSNNTAPDTDPADIEIDETLPDLVKKFLRQGYELEEIRLGATGKWTHEGLDFENPRITDLFSRSVGRTEGGTWVLEVGRFTYPITVEDAGFFVERIDLTKTPPKLPTSPRDVCTAPSRTGSFAPASRSPPTTPLPSILSRKTAPSSSSWTGSGTRLPR